VRVGCWVGEAKIKGGSRLESVNIWSGIGAVLI